MFRRTRSRICTNACSRTGRLWRGLGRLRSCSGFSLVELIVIMALVGVLVTTVGMKSGWLTSGPNLRMAIDQVAADLRFLQAQSMATMAYTGGNAVSFANGGISYSLPMVLRQGTTYVVVGQWKMLPSGVTISSGTTVVFNSLGEYTSNSDANLVLKSGTVMGTVTIYATSGDVGAY
jgi:type II secretory pathway pseudopilin PulG